MFGEYVGTKLKIRVGEDGYCIFFREGKGCIVHEGKPSICKAWPFFRGNLVDEVSFSMAREDCPGIMREVSHVRFAREGYRYLKDYKLLARDGLHEGRALVVEEKELPNVRFIRMDAEELTEVFGAGEADRIYLNFSDPWPKDRHAKRRLPSRQFLERYAQILKPEGTIEFKTDNRALFDFALDELEPAGWKAEEVTFDLHADGRLMRGNVMTEYEERFSSAGNPICKYIIRKAAPEA